MKQLFKKTWFQVVVFGIAIGAILIIVDSKVKFGEERPEVYKGAIESKTDEMYFAKIEYAETSFDFGKVKEGDTIIHQFKIKNPGNEPLLIFKAKGSCECIRGIAQEEVIPAGKESMITVYFKTAGRKGSQTRTVTVNTNTEPSEQTLTLTGTVE